jgi:hypothetical protein
MLVGKLEGEARDEYWGWRIYLKVDLAKPGSKLA